MGLPSITQTVVVTSVLTATGIIVRALYRKWKEIKIPVDWQKIGYVEKIYIYPLKSGRKIELDSAECTREGLKQTKENSEVLQLRDRSLMVYGRDNKFRTARTYPKLVLINISVLDENVLAFDAPDMTTLFVKIPKRDENNTTYVKCWYNEDIQVIDCGEEAAVWFSKFLLSTKFGLRLASNDGKSPRDITKTHQKLLNYYTNLSNKDLGLCADLSSVSLINQKSLDDMNDKIGNNFIGVDNFRPNILVDNPYGEPFEEDDWDWVRIGEEVVLRSVKENTRCSLVTVDPRTGDFNKNREPLNTLNTYRKSEGPEKAPVMGLYLGVRRAGLIRVGEPVYVTKKG